MSTLERIIHNVSGKNRAVVVPDSAATLNYDQLRSAIADFKVDLSRINDGKLLKVQDIVSIAIPNGLEFIVTFIGVTGSSLIAAPLNPQYKQQEFEFYLDDVKSKLLLVPQKDSESKIEAVAAASKLGVNVAEVGWNGTKVVIKLLKKGQESEEVGTGQSLRASHSDDTALILHTSGTTGRPKAVPLAHRNILASVRNIVGTYKLSELDTSYIVMPLFHIHGLVAGLLSPLGSGGAVIVPPKFSASQFWKHWQDFGATWYTAVPTIHQIILKHPVPSEPKIRFIRSCSSSLAPSVFHELEKKLGAPVLEAYAMTEACHQMTSNSLSPDMRKPGTVGVGHGVEVVILDDKGNILPKNTEGEISVRGPNVTSGYLNNPKANEESFTAGSHFFRTGDQGKIDEDGMLVITGRIKELINRGGEKISPIELDSILLSHEAVEEAVVFGADDKMYGQVVNAVVVLKKNGKATEKELQEYVASKVSSFKVPTKIFFTDEMPKTATGKIQRRIIAQKFSTPLAKL